MTSHNKKEKMPLKEKQLLQLTHIASSVTGISIVCTHFSESVSGGSAISAKHQGHPTLPAAIAPALAMAPASFARAVNSVDVFIVRTPPKKLKWNLRMDH